MVLGANSELDHGGFHRGTQGSIRIECSGFILRSSILLKAAAAYDGIFERSKVLPMYCIRLLESMASLRCQIRTETGMNNCL